MAVDHNNPQSRNEEILIATIDGTEYNKLPQSRMEELLLELKEVIEEGGGGGGIRPIGVTTTPLYDGATTNPIQINGESYTAKTGDMVTYQSTEFLFNVNEVWQELGDVSEVLAIIDNIFVDIAPAFDAAGTYAVGDYVIYNDQLYRCTTAHTGAWDENDFAATTISDEIADVSDAVDEIKDGTDIDSFADVETALADKVNKVNGKDLSTNDYDDTEKAAVAAATSAISAMKDGSDIDSFGDVEVALLDKANISDLGTAAAKDSTNTVTSGSTDLVESGAVKDAIDAAVSSAYHHAGTKTVAQLTHDLLIAANEGNVYNITDSGTTTSDFIEGIGKTIDEGSNVGICKVGNVYMFDLLSGFVNTTNFVQKSVTAGLLKNDGTVNDEIEGDVSTLKSGLTDLSEEVNGDATTYPYADVITIEDAVPSNLADCSVKIEPVQDLHGQSAPYVGGAWKNKLPLTVDSIKAANTSGTWSGNAYTVNGVTFTVQTDSDGNVTGITIESTGASANVLNFLLGTYTVSTAVILNGYAGTWNTDNAILKAYIGSSIEYATGSTGNVTISDAGTYNIGISIKSGFSGTINMYPMLRLATETDATFAPYTNICPISGHTEASVQRDGKNFCPYGSMKILDGEYFTLPAGTYTFSLKVLGSNKYSTSHIGLYDDPNELALCTVRGSAGSMVNTQVTLAKSTQLYVRVVNMDADSNGYYCDNIQIELGSSSTDYEPFKGKTYTIALGDTIYGGTVDFDSGVMTVTHKTLVCDGSDSFTYGLIEGVGIAFTGIDNDYKHGTSVAMLDSNLYPSVVQVNSNIEFTTATQSMNCAYTLKLTTPAACFIKDVRFTSVEVAKAILAETPLQVCYELATPFTVQLTPQQIQLLKGQNTLTASTGDISVTVNGVSGSIGAVQEQVNELETRVATVENNVTTKAVFVTGTITNDAGTQNQTLVNYPSGFDRDNCTLYGLYQFSSTSGAWYPSPDKLVAVLGLSNIILENSDSSFTGRSFKFILVKSV